MTFITGAFTWACLKAGAGALGLVLTAVLPNILEDALAVAFAAAVGYLALLNLPLRRGEAKAKVERVAANFAKVAPAPPPCGSQCVCLLSSREGLGAGGASWRAPTPDATN